MRAETDLLCGTFKSVESTVVVELEDREEPVEEDLEPREAMEGAIMQLGRVDMLWLLYAVCDNGNRTLSRRVRRS